MYRYYRKILSRNAFLIYRNINTRRTKDKNKSSSEYCLELVKTHEYENFICTLLLQNSKRSRAFAVRSFNVEIARIAAQVSQDSTALMRLKFWEDTLESCFSNNYMAVPKHPVAVELFKAINTGGLTKRYFKTLILSRKENFNFRGFESLEDMEKYAESTVSNVFYLILEGCGVKNINADHVASHLGKAQGIIQHLRSIPRSRQLGFLPVPQNVLIKNKVSQEEVIRGKVSERLNECTFEIASRAHQHLVKARGLIESVPIEARTALLPAVPVFIYLDRLQKVDYDVFHPSLQYRSWKMLPLLWLTNFRNKY